MDTGLQNRTEHFVHDLSNPGAAGLCPEMLEVAEEACRAGDFHLAAEIYSSQLADLQQPDRGLCLRRADALARAGRISEALESYCVAANLHRLRPDELGPLVDNVARTLRDKVLGGGDAREDERAADMFSCPLCECLLSEPTTLECGHTFCRRCLEERGGRECGSCRGRPREGHGFRVNVVLGGLLDKWFEAESRSRRFWLEGEVLRRKSELPAALDKFNKAVDLTPSISRLVGQRADLLMDMKNFSQAMQDGDSLCRLKPLWSKAHYIRAKALSGVGRAEEALQEYFYCVALKPDWSAVKLEAQKVQHPNSTQPNETGDLECSLCMRLFYEPVTTPCGHTFCLKCLERCLDHNSNCPLCKENLSEYLANRGYHKTFLMEEVLQRYLGEELAERKKLHEEEMKELSNLNQEVPIFVCTMAFPTIPCPLHVFEPRYRLMIRRSMETGTKQFGMCIADELKGFADYGCMLEVKDVKFFPDGRSVVDTVGVSRFKVLSHGQRDGYNTAKIEYLEDKKVEGEELAELLKLHDSVYDQATAWFTSLKDNMKNQILSHFGHLPAKDPDPQGNPSGPAWCWWLLAVLPLENRAQLTILAMTSLKDRLIAIRRVLIFVTRKRPR
uniref:Uncharacterized protein n=1 Tax=Denticeps clupeoides TaxID=299321 RepID=A0AAY4DGB9_9TELE